MDDLPIVISLDPEPAVTANKKIAAATRETEEAAKKAAQATTSLGEQLARVGRYQQILADAERKQTAAALGSVRAFDGLTAAIQREQQMLDRLHGPMQRAEQDMQTLESLHRRGAISAKEYAAELDRIHKASGGALGGSIANTVSLAPSQGAGAGARGGELARQASERIVGATSVGGFLGGLAGGFVGGNAISLLTQGIGSLIDKWGEHDRAIAVAEKSLRGMFETTGETARAVGDLDRAAAHAGASLKDMTPVYQAVAEASEEWYLTTLDQVNVTEQLANLARKSGREIETATTFIKAFNVATADGVVSSGEFNQLAKTFPEAMNAWAKSLGVSRYELGVLAGQGKVTTKEVNAFFASLRDGVPIAERADNALRLGGPAQYALWMDAARLAGEKFWNDLQRQILETRRMMDEITHRQFGDFVAGIDGVRDVAGSAWKGMNSLFNGDGWTDSLLKRGLDTLDVSTRHATASARAATDEYMRLHGILVKITEEGRNLPGPPSSWQSVANNDAFARQYGFKPTPLTDPYAGGATPGGIAKDLHDANPAAKELQEHVTTIGDLFANQLVTAAGSFADTLVDAAFNADVSFKQWGLNTLEMLGKMILRAELLQAITGSATGAKGAAGWGGLIGALGFATGGDALMTTSGLHRIPAAATGYEGRMTGAGPTDSRLAMIRMTPGEFIKVQTPEQRRSDQRPSGGTTVQNVFQYDKRALLPALSSPDGKAAIVNVIRENSEMIRALLR